MMKVKNKKGITLIALIITVIIMVLLASVVMWQAIADDGIINKVISGRDKYNEERAREELAQCLNEWKIEKHLNQTATLKSFLEGKGYTVIDIGEGNYKVVKNNYYFTVNSDLKIQDEIETTYEIAFESQSKVINYSTSSQTIEITRSK